MISDITDRLVLRECMFRFDDLLRSEDVRIENQYVYCEGVEINISEQHRKLSIQEFSEKIVLPAIHVLVAQIKNKFSGKRVYFSNKQYSDPNTFSESLDGKVLNMSVVGENTLFVYVTLSSNAPISAA